jgi:hypothetical protein
VGGKLEAPEGSDSPSLSGIFIKNVLSGSPAAATNQLNTGDRIIAVGDVDLRYASHDKVGTIQPERLLRCWGSVTFWFESVPMINRSVSGTFLL